MMNKSKKVTFLNEGGWEKETEEARNAGFVEGEEYTVQRTEMHSWSSYYFIEGKPGKWNTVMFEEVQDTGKVR